MNAKDQLTSLGWSIKSEFFEGNKQRLDEMKKQLLDTDIRQFGEKSLPDIARLDRTTKSYIVQLHKTRNVTASKDNETSSNRAHLYRLMITDGHVFQNALVLPSLKNFNIDTPPGVKILLKANTKIFNGFYVLNDQTCEVLGGSVSELVQKWKLARLMGKHVRTLIGEGAPPPWVPFGTKHTKTVDTSQRSMDVAKMQQTTDEDPEFVRQRRAAIDTLLKNQMSKTQRFAEQDVIRGSNLAKGFEQVGQRAPVEKSNLPSASSVTTKSTNPAATAAAIKTNTRLPEWAKNQIADDTVEDNKGRGQGSRPNFNDDNNRRGGMGRNRRGRGRGRGGDDDDGGEETRPSKDVTLFDFFGATPKPQKAEPKSTQNKPTSNQPGVSKAIQQKLFGYENGDQVLARYHEDNEYYPAVIINIMYDKQKCSVMFEGYDSQDIVSFDDIEPYEEGYYDGEEEEEEEYEQEQQPPPPPHPSKSSAGPQRQNTGSYQYQQAQNNYGYYNQQQDNHNRQRPNSGRGYQQQQQQQQQQQYSSRYNNANYYY